MTNELYNDLLIRFSSYVDANTLNTISRDLLIAFNGYNFQKKIIATNPDKSLLYSCIDKFLAMRRIEGLSKGTINLYRIRLKQFASAMIVPLDKITKNDIMMFLFSAQQGKYNKYHNFAPLSERTLDNIRTALCSFFNWCTTEGYIIANPCLNIKPFKYNKKSRSYLSDVELEKLRSSCTNLRDKAILETLYSTGCKVSELTNLKKSYVDFVKNTVLLFGKGSKYRTSYLNAKAKLALTDYLNSRTDDSDYLFVRCRNVDNLKLGVTSVEKIIRKLGVKSGLSREVCPHLIRHTTATLASQRGMPSKKYRKCLDMQI